MFGSDLRWLSLKGRTSTIEKLFFSFARLILLMIAGKALMCFLDIITGGSYDPRTFRLLDRMKAHPAQAANTVARFCEMDWAR